MDFFIRLAKWDIFKQPPKGQKSKWFLKQFWNFFSPKHSDFYCKLSGESILFGPMVLKNLLYSEFGLFHGYLPQFFTFLSKTVIFLLIFKNMFMNTIFTRNRVIWVVNWVRNPFLLVPWLYKNQFFQNWDFS